VGKLERKSFKRIQGENWIGGICGGLAYAFGWPALIVRIIVLVCWLSPAVFLVQGWGSIFVVYIIAWILAPKWEEIPEDYDERTA